MLNRGYSRDQRPDLNQVMLDLIVEHQAGIPVLMKPLSGNRSDAHDFSQIITDHMALLQITYGTTFLVADYWSCCGSCRPRIRIITIASGSIR